MTFKLKVLNDLATKLDDQTPEYVLAAMEEVEFSYNNPKLYKMPFGKYKDKSLKLISSEDVGYIRWLKKQNGIDGQLKDALNNL